MLFVVSYCCDTTEGEDMYGVQHWTTVDRTGTLCPVSRELFCSKNRAVNTNMQECCVLAKNTQSSWIGLVE